MNKNIYAYSLISEKPMKHCGVFQCLQSINIDEIDVFSIANFNFFINNQTRFETRLYIMPGSVYSVYHNIFRNFEHITGVKLIGTNIKNLSYTDVTVLLAEDITQL